MIVTNFMMVILVVNTVTSEINTIVNITTQSGGAGRR